MSLRPPSNLRPYNDFYSGDPAIARPPPNATDEEKKVHEHKIEVARETGDWTAIVVEGQQPTRFTLRQLPGDVYDRLCDELNAKKLGPLRMAQIAFRAAIIAIANCGDLEIERADDPAFGSIATVGVTNTLHTIDPDIVRELGLEVLRRARSPSPK